ncbi:MAG: hypothetical protein IJ276_03370 [Alphaproteobacteria bacterium]|nr:hypothetical protein [Alphaproteobacteria bacterium]
MKTRIADFIKFSALLTAVCTTGALVAAQPQNPRAASNSIVAPQRADGSAVKRGDGNTDVAQTVVSRAATANTGRRANANVARSGAVAPAAGRVSGRAATANASKAKQELSTARSGMNVARSAAAHVANTARSATNASTSGVSRAGLARATAVFDDVSKIGGGYAGCRDAYATCMDQFCAKANETYRRCFCSSRFTDFRDTEYAMDEAKRLLMQFEDNNLNAVDKTAAEVNAMYTATVGEMAIKNDVSGAQSILNEIGDLLSGKKKTSTPAKSTGGSLGVLDLDFTADAGDIWSGSGVSSIFGGGTGTNLNDLEGQELYNAASAQCVAMVKDTCQSTAVSNMAQSAYGIMISQDCNAYEKNVDAKREGVLQTVRQAEKYLREARLEEYRSHNSADVNECLDKVRSALTQDTACGANYKRCLDYSGAYINQSTGEPIYSPRLFELTDLIKLDGSADILTQNEQFNSFLETRKMFAATALDSCRDISQVVWDEFKRVALIEIAQAQDVKLEEVRMSCVSTMKECYDTQTNALKSFDDTTAQAAGAISVYAAKEMCQDKVIACASLYGNTDGCEFDGNGKLTKGNSSSSLTASASCGLTALLAFVDNVDTVRVAEGCSGAIDNYVTELCTPTTGTHEFPWNCRLKPLGAITDVESPELTATLTANIKQFAVDNCANPTATDKSFDSLPTQTRIQVEKSIQDIAEQLEYQLLEECEALDGYWVETDEQGTTPTLKAFYKNVYAGDEDRKDWGVCIENTIKVRCEAYNAGAESPLATYNATTDECIFTDAWYQQQCTILGNGYWENGTCFVKPE